MISNTCLAPAVYTSSEILDREIDRLFRDGWVGVGRADLVPGEYRTLTVGRVPVILLRDRAGTLRAFNNACQHRGTRLLVGAGNCRAIACPFHAWTYGLDGALIHAPRMDETPGFRKADHGLHEFAAAERAGFAFVSLTSAPPDIDCWLGDFEALHAPWPLASLVSTRRERLEVACNWKAFLDVFNEYYHLPYVHPGSIGGLFQEPDPSDATTGAYASQFGTTEGRSALTEGTQDHALPAMPGLAGRAATGTRYTWLFPNMTFAVSQDTVWLYDVQPLGPDRCEVHRTACFPPETVSSRGFEDRIAHYYRRLDEALNEDVVVLEAQQAGLSSPFATAGPFAALLEGNVARFAAWYRDRMAV